MRRVEIYIIAGVLLVLLFLFAYLYIFNIYEVTYSVTPPSLYADYQSTVIIEAEPVNSFGWKVPFRHVPAQFEIREGKDLVDQIFKDTHKGILKLKAKNKVGTVIVYIKAKYALLPSSVQINIYPNQV